MAETPRQVLERYTDLIIQAFIKSLENNDKVARGGLQQSISVQIRAFATKFSIEISMAEYWKYVDSGVNGLNVNNKSPYSFKKDGKPIPLDSIKSFIANRGLQLRSMNIAKRRTLEKVKGKGKLSKKIKKSLISSQYDSMAFAIGKSIKKKGIKPTNFINEALESGVFTNLQRDISEALGREIIIDLNLK